MAYDYDGIIICYRVLVGTTVNGEYYAEFLRKSWRPIIRKLRPKKLQKSVLLLHDNTCPRLHEEVQRVIEENS